MFGSVDLNLVTGYVERQSVHLAHLKPGTLVYQKTEQCLKFAKDRLKDADSLAESTMEDESHHRRWL